jgi:hypothetical protein
VVADKKISALDAVSELTGAESIAVVQGGVTKRSTIGEVRVDHVDDVSGEVTLVAADSGRLKRATAASIITLPADVPIATRVDLLRDTNGALHLVPGTGAQIVSLAGPSVNVVAQYGIATAVVVAEDRWYVAGDISPVDPDAGADTTAPTVPTSVTVNAPTSSSLTVSWGASTDDVGVAGYRVRRGGTVVGSATASPFVDTNLTSSTEYTYTVSAFDAAGNESAQTSGVAASTASGSAATPDTTVATTASSNTAGVHTGGLSVAHPEGMVDGAVAVVVGGLTRQAGGFVTWTPPTGFEERDSLDVGGGTTHGAVFAKKIVDAGTEPAWTLDVTPTGTPTVLSMSAAAVAVTGIEDPADLEISMAANAAGTSHAAPSVTVDTDGSLVLSGMVGARDGTWTPPSGYTELADVASLNNTATDRVSVTIAESDVTVDIGTASPGSFTYTLARAAVGYSVAAAPISGSTAPSDALLYAPPDLVDPVTINVSNTNRGLVLDGDTDYIINMPETPLDTSGGLSINGGRNVVLIGGEINFSEDYSTASNSVGKSNRGLYLRGTRGTLHIEGLLVGGVVGEGIDLSMSYGGTVQLCNVAIDTTSGALTSNHADLIQTWCGPERLLIDGFTGSTVYQGFFLLPTQFAAEAPLQFGTWEFNRVNLSGTTAAGYLYWLADSNFGSAPPVTVSNCWGDPNPTKTSRIQWLWPQNDPKWDGVQQGTPPGGDFVTTAGLGYVSPG